MVLKQLSSVFLVLGLTCGTVYAQNDTIPPQDGFNEQEAGFNEEAPTLQSDPVSEKPTSTKKSTVGKGPWRNRNFNPKYGFRKFLNKFSFTPLIGYSKTFYREKVGSTEEPSDFNGGGVPIMGTLNFHVNRFRIGGGAGLEFHSIKDEEVAMSQGLINKKSTTFTKFYGNLGAEVYQYWDYMLVPEVQVGKIKLGKGFNGDSISNGLFINIGVSVEKVMSEYFRFIAKPSYEFRNFTKTDAADTKYKMPGLSLMVGFSIRYPDIPRCPISACSTQIMHLHFGNEYRGKPLPIKQNRKYGELNKRLLKYRGKNKKKLNPY